MVIMLTGMTWDSQWSSCDKHSHATHSCLVVANIPRNDSRLEVIVFTNKARKQWGEYNNQLSLQSASKLIFGHKSKPHLKMLTKSKVQCFKFTLARISRVHCYLATKGMSLKLFSTCFQVARTTCQPLKTHCQVNNVPPTHQSLVFIVSSDTIKFYP